MQLLITRVAMSASLALLVAASAPNTVEAFVIVSSRSSSLKSAGIKRLPRRPRRLADLDIRAEVGIGSRPSASPILTPPSCADVFDPNTAVIPRTTERRRRWRPTAAAAAAFFASSIWTPHAGRRPSVDEPAYSYSERRPPIRFDTLAAAGLCKDSGGGSFDAASRRGHPRAQQTAGRNLTNGGRRPVVATTRLASIGFLGQQGGLLLLSTLLVSAVKQIFFAPKSSTAGEEEGNEMQQQQQQQQQAGIMNRCPWPFIFFHDPAQGFRDSPTWVVVTWLALWRLVKLTSKARAV